MKTLSLARLALCAALLASAHGALSNGAPARHFAANSNFDANATFAPAAAGFDLADVSYPQQLDKLPPGVLGLVWVGQCAGANEEFKTKLQPYLRRSRIFGFYLMDDPDPSGKWRARCSVENLRAEADWIHAEWPEARTFVALMNIGTSSAPAYTRDYAPSKSHVDLFGIAPYPCRVNSRPCDLDMIDHFVRAAVAAGIPHENIVPTYQTFGGGQWRPTDGAGDYRLPDAGEMESMLETWKALIGNPEMEFAYSWGRQRDDEALESAPDLQQVFSRHNRD